jgi:SAM-dependent methyltransferase
LYRDYWDQFYAKPHPELQDPSPFARFCLAHTAGDSVLVELGCGNGRDALFFARNGLTVTAYDQSTTAIERLRGVASSSDVWVVAPRFIVKRFEDLVDDGRCDVVYSRFTLHTVDAPVASQTLRWAFRNLRPAGQIFIEARTVKDDLYARGEPAGRDAFIHDGHYRRFIRTEELSAELEDIGFVVDELVEADGLATFGADDPVVVRAVASRSGT